ncbi:MAG: hypothetical protein HY314_01755 [Acidobacteria bacterium]|nr:hypothetical protein [Acidobacteriota bacterium]
MTYKLKTTVGQAIYGLRKCTVEPVIGIIKKVIGFQQLFAPRVHRGCRRMVPGVLGFQFQTITSPPGISVPSR